MNTSSLKKAFTATELLTALTICAIIASIAYAPLRDAMIKANGRAATATLQTVEQVKRQYAADHPKELEADYITLREEYFGGEIPAMPRNGERILNICDLTKAAVSNFNGIAEYEPWGGNEDVLENGYGDLGRNAAPAVQVGGNVIVFEGQEIPPNMRAIAIKGLAACDFADVPAN